MKRARLLLVPLLLAAALMGETPEALETMSWTARRALGAGNLDQAMDVAAQTQKLCEEALATRKLDAEPHLPIALGAAVEVQAQVLNKQGRKSEAVQLIDAALKTYAGTSIIPRLRKNLNLITLQGKPLPTIHAAGYIGSKTLPPTLHGKVVLLFLWAHWCPDCKAEAPILERLGKELGPRGLTIAGPTKFYGYAARGENATPAQEKQYIQGIYEQYYARIPNMAVPLSEANFTNFGVSTTPTIVIADRRGIVRLYHPGAMTEADLRSALLPLFD